MVKTNVKDTHINPIITFMDKSENGTSEPQEKILKDIDIIKKYGDKWFELSVKRVSIITTINIDVLST